MAQANDSVLVTPGAGATIATELINAKEYQVLVLADAKGHIFGGRETFHVCDDAGGAFAASSRLLMLFNASATYQIEVIQLYVISTATAAITGLIRGLKAQRSTAIPSAGATAITPVPLDTAHALAASVTAYRQTAVATPATQTLTASTFLGLGSAAQEENSGGASKYMVFDEQELGGEPILLRQNQGITIVNDATAMLGVVWAGCYFRQRLN